MSSPELECSRTDAPITKLQSGKVRASLDKTCPKCGFTITPDLVKRVDFERMECLKCGEKFQTKIA